jgi:hypothetical protein
MPGINTCRIELDALHLYSCPVSDYRSPLGKLVRKDIVEYKTVFQYVKNHFCGKRGCPGKELKLLFNRPCSMKDNS